MIEEVEVGNADGTALAIRATAEIQPAQRREFACDLEKILESDKLRSMRREARDAMCVRDQVLVVLCEKESLTETGLIVVPDVAQEKPSEGLVIAVGPGRLDANNVWIPTVVQPRDRVLFGKYAGVDIMLRERACRLMHEEEILLVVR